MAALTIAVLSGPIRAETPEGYFVLPSRENIREPKAPVVAAIAARGMTLVNRASARASPFPQVEHSQAIPMANPKSCSGGPF